MTKKTQTRKLVFCIILAVLSFSLFAQETVSVYSGKKTPMLEFALADLRNELNSQGITIRKAGLEDAEIILIMEADFTGIKSEGIKPPKIDFRLKEEGFCIKKDKEDNIWVLGADDPGLMYGVLELAEQIRIAGLENIEETSQNPYMPVRGVKFNIPLDVRTPTYTDPSEACQQNMAEMWSMDFWTEFLDELARHRYNLVSLWNLHAFPSMIRVPEYPDVALDDVRRTTRPLDRYWAIGNGVKYPSVLANTELVRNMSIEEKILFWQKVMRYAKERNVDFYLMQWNIFDFGIEGKYGINEEIDNPVTKDYFRKSVRQMLLTYPDLAGIGITVGENMIGQPADVKEAWAYDTYGKGVLDALELDTDRKLTFIHRLHQGQVKNIEDQFAALIKNKNVNFIFSFKYAEAHIMSSTNQPYSNKFVKEIEGKKRGK